MKKFLFLTLIFGALISTRMYAQSAPDPAVMLQQMKDRVKPQMVEKTGLTEAQADKVIELNFEMRQAAAAFRDLPEADRSKRIADLKTAKDKKMSEFLTAEQIKAVKSFYEELVKNAPPKN
jgi:Skp family chaperone for outer membrane proteins